MPIRRDMPRLARSLAFGPLLLVLLASGAPAEVYRWTDEAGGTRYAGKLSQVPPEKRAEAVDSVNREAPSRLQTFEAPAARPAARSAASGAVLRIPYEQHGNAILVHARLNDRVTAPFYVDTGAADVVIPAGVAAQAGVEVTADTPREIYATANGMIRQAVVRLDAVEIGDARVENVRGSVSDSLPVGLLGTSFFNHFTLQIDPAARMLMLVRNPNMPGGVSAEQWSERFRALHERQARLEAYLEDGTLADPARARQLAARREELAAKLEALEAEADRAQVPESWRMMRRSLCVLAVGLGLVAGAARADCSCSSRRQDALHERSLPVPGRGGARAERSAPAHALERRAAGGVPALARAPGGQRHRRRGGGAGLAREARGGAVRAEADRSPARDAPRSGRLVQSRPRGMGGGPGRHPPRRRLRGRRRERARAAPRAEAPPVLSRRGPRRGVPPRRLPAPAGCDNSNFFLRSLRSLRARGNRACGVAHRIRGPAGWSAPLRRGPLSAAS